MNRKFLRYNAMTQPEEAGVLQRAEDGGLVMFTDVENVLREIDDLKTRVQLVMGVQIRGLLTNDDLIGSLQLFIDQLTFERDKAILIAETRLELMTGEK